MNVRGSLDDLNYDLNLYYEENEFLRLKNELEAKFKSVSSSNADSHSVIFSFYDLLDNIPINALYPTQDRNNIRWRIFSRLSSVLDSMVEHVSGFDAAGLCVIQKSVFDELKLKLSRSNRPIVAAPSLFASKGIPEACHRVLLTKMGFK